MHHGIGLVGVNRVVEHLLAPGLVARSAVDTILVWDPEGHWPDTLRHWKVQFVARLEDLARPDITGVVLGTAPDESPEALRRLLAASGRGPLRDVLVAAPPAASPSFSAEAATGAGIGVRVLPAPLLEARLAPAIRAWTALTDDPLHRIRLTSGRAPAWMARDRASIAAELAGLVATHGAEAALATEVDEGATMLVRLAGGLEVSWELTSAGAGRGLEAEHGTLRLSGGDTSVVAALAPIGAPGRFVQATLDDDGPPPHRRPPPPVLDLSPETAGDAVVRTWLTERPSPSMWPTFPEIDRVAAALAASARAGGRLMPIPSPPAR